MISLDTAHLLRDAGVRWEPEAGDRFVITDPRTDDEVYVVSDMTIDVHRFASGTVLGFNGTTEWALDSVDQARALWLPRESQLRALLGTTFRRFERVEPASSNGQDTDGQSNDDQDSDGQRSDDQGTDGQRSDGQGRDGQDTDGQSNDDQGTDGQGSDGAGGGGWRVQLVVLGQPVEVVDDDAEQAYARALLVLITGDDVPGGRDRIVLA